jgi:hypothetical protein
MNAFFKKCIHDAVYAGDIAAVDAMLSRGCDPDQVDQEGTSLLHLAARLTGPVAEDMVRLLLRRGANVFIANMFGETPLHQAAWSSCARAYTVLLEATDCTGVTMRDCDCLTPLHYIINSPHEHAAASMLTSTVRQCPMLWISEPGLHNDLWTRVHFIGASSVIKDAFLRWRVLRQLFLVTCVRFQQ